MNRYRPSTPLSCSQHAPPVSNASLHSSLPCCFPLTPQLSAEPRALVSSALSSPLPNSVPCADGNDMLVRTPAFSTLLHLCNRRYDAFNCCGRRKPRPHVTRHIWNLAQTSTPQTQGTQNSATLLLTLNSSSPPRRTPVTALRPAQVKQTHGLNQHACSPKAATFTSPHGIQHPNNVRICSSPCTEVTRCTDNRSSYNSYHKRVQPATQNSHMMLPSIKSSYTPCRTPVTALRPAQVKQTHGLNQHACSPKAATFTSPHGIQHPNNIRICSSPCTEVTRCTDNRSSYNSHRKIVQSSSFWSKRASVQGGAVHLYTQR